MSVPVPKTEIVMAKDVFSDTTWDDFVYNAYNGSFAQTKLFLDYHPSDRFSDFSCAVMFKGKPVALIPACVLNQDGKEVLYSHRGSTFGGCIIDPLFMTSAYIESILHSFDSFIQAKGFAKVVLRQLPSLFSLGSVGTLDYMLGKHGYKAYTELSFIVDLQGLNSEDDLFSSYRLSTKQQTMQGISKGCTVREVDDVVLIEKFHELLSNNLTRHDAKPIHSVVELVDLKKRFPGVVKIFGCFFDKKMIGGAMTWLYNKRVLHLQNICIDYEYQLIRPGNVLNHKFLVECIKNRIPYYSFGISTEDNGSKLNTGLARYKEGFGAQGFPNKIYYKEYA